MSSTETHTYTSIWNFQKMRSLHINNTRRHNAVAGGGSSDGASSINKFSGGGGAGGYRTGTCVSMPSAVQTVTVGGGVAVGAMVVMVESGTFTYTSCYDINRWWRWNSGYPIPG